MALRLQIISDQRRLLGEHATIVFGERGGRIGRAADNDWVLPDPRRYLSAHHAAIHFEGGNFLLEDTSTNGVYVNDATIPVGRSARLVLQDGDILRLGDYQFRAYLDAIEVRSSLSDELVAIDKVEPLRRAGEPVRREPGPAALDLGAPSSASLTMAGKLHPSEADVTGIEGSSRLSAIFDLRAGLHAFCRGAGLETNQLPQDADLRVLLLAGQLLRESLLGLQGLIRAQREFQLQTGTDAPASSVEGPAPDATSPSDYLLKLLNGQEDSALDAVQILRNWFDASLRHEVAFQKSLAPALTAFLRHLDPEMIEGRARARGAPESAFPIYADLFRQLNIAARGELPRQFTEAFTKAYTKSGG